MCYIKIFLNGKTQLGFPFLSLMFCTGYKQVIAFDGPNFFATVQWGEIIHLFYIDDFILELATPCALSSKVSHSLLRIKRHLSHWTPFQSHPLWDFFLFGRNIQIFGTALNLLPLAYFLDFISWHSPPCSLSFLSCWSFSYSNTLS